MSNLSNRVEKAKKLEFQPIPGVKGGFATYGSKNDRYEIVLSHEKQTVCLPDGDKEMLVFLTDCQMTHTPNIKEDTKWQWVNGQDGQGNLQRTYKQVNTKAVSLTCNCKGNERHTVCYHSLGAIYRSFEKVGKLVSFFDTYEQAVQGLNFGGYVAKVQSKNGEGFEWCVVRDWPTKPQILDSKTNINLMRGDENDEGID